MNEKGIGTLTVCHKGSHHGSDTKEIEEFNRMSKEVLKRMSSPAKVSLFGLRH
jgi:hypothetical protein